jgi:hypothetical protein
MKTTTLVVVALLVGAGAGPPAAPESPFAELGVERPLRPTPAPEVAWREQPCTGSSRPTGWR